MPSLFMSPMRAAVTRACLLSTHRLDGPAIPGSPAPVLTERAAQYSKPPALCEAPHREGVGMGHHIAPTHPRPG